jgi:hypothetical protein
MVGKGAKNSQKFVSSNHLKNYSKWLEMHFQRKNILTKSDPPLQGGGVIDQNLTQHFER